MSPFGYIQVHAYTSFAQIPLKDVAVTVIQSDGKTVAMRLTNRSGQFDEPLQVETPSMASGLSPNSGTTPYTRVNLYARLAGYEAIEIENLQVFANTVTVQNLEMIPLSEFPDSYNRLELFDTPPQNL